MLFSNQKNFNLTLICCIALVFSLAASSNAHIQQRDHVNLKRLIKKRSPFPQDSPSISFPPVAGAGGPAPPLTSASVSPSSSISSSSASSSSAPDTTSDAQSSSSSSVSSSSSSSSAASSSDSSATSRISTTTSTTESTPTSIPASESLIIIGASNLPTPATKPPVTLTRSVDASQTNTSAAPQTLSAAATSKSKTVTILIIVGSSIAGIAILWTIFRKWKLGRSSKFDERMQPIDWQPTNDDGDLPGLHRRPSVASSFRSAGDHVNSGRSHGGSDLSHTNNLYALPEHDFTPGPATLAPVGGYADLARGPSPKPQMNQVNYSANMTRPGYDTSLPLHHQGGYGDTYDHGKRY